MLRTFRSSEAPASATDLRLAARTAAGTPIGSSAPKALEAVSVITSWPNRQGMTDLPQIRPGSDPRGDSGFAGSTSRIENSCSCSSAFAPALQVWHLGRNDTAQTMTSNLAGTAPVRGRPDT